MLSNVNISVFVVVWALWLGSEILLNRRFRSGEDDQKDQDKGTERVLWIGLLFGNLLALLASIYFPLRMSANPMFRTHA